MSQQTRHHVELELKQISPTEWLATDVQEFELTGIGIVGFIERTNGSYEVLSFSELTKRAYFGSLEAAASFLVDRARP